MSKRWFARCFQWATTVFVVLLLLIALVLTLSRVFVVVVAHQRSFVEHWLSAAMKQPIQIQSIKADWTGFDPGLTVNDVLVKNNKDQHAFIKIKRLTVSVDILRSFVHWKLLPKRLTLQGVHLSIDDERGHLRVRGILSSSTQLHLSDHATKFEDLLNWVLAEGDVRIQNVSVDFHTKDHRTYFLRRLSILVQNDFFTHRISGSAFVNKLSPTEIRFTAKVKDIDFRDAKFNADFYVLFKNVHLEQWANSTWLRPYVKSLRVAEGDANLELWGAWNKTKVVGLQGRWDFSNILLQFPKFNQFFTIHKMLADFTWHPLAHSINLQISRILFSLPNFYRSPIRINRLSTQIHWSKNTAGLSIYVPYYQFTMLGFMSHGAFNLQIPKTGKPTVDLISQYHFPKYLQFSHWIPDRNRSTHLDRWLKQAFLGGGVTAATLVYRGPIEAAPFENRDGHMVAELQVANGSLSYRSGWPALSGLNGNIEVNDRQISASFPHAFIGSNPVNVLKARLDDFLVPDLKIQGEVSSQVSNLHQFIQHSPLAISETSFKCSLKGRVKLNMRLQIDFSQPGFPVKSEGKASVIGNTFVFKSHTEDSKIHFGLKGLLNFDSLTSQLPENVLKGISGKTRYQATIDIDHQHTTVLNLVSDMRGIRLSGFPRFIDKPAKKARPIHLRVSIPKSNRIEVQLRYQKNILLRLLAKRQDHQFKWVNGGIYFGKQPLSKYPTTSTGFVIYGHIAVFHWLKWKPIIMPFVHEKKGAFQTPKVFGLPLRYVEFHFDKMEVLNQQLNNMNIKLMPRPSDWTFQLKSPQITGTFYIPNYHGGTWTGTLDFLSIAKLKKSPSKKKYKPLMPDSRNIPPIDLEIKKFQYGNTDYGEVELRARPNKMGLSINSFSIQSPLLTLKLNGMWLQGPQHQSTTLKGFFKTNNLGQLLSDFGLPGTIPNGRGVANFQLSWPAAIDAMKTKILTGYLGFNFHHGRFLKMDESKSTELGLGRWMNAFSLESLPRHLSLHFKDVTDEGLAFRVLKGEVSIKDGIAHMKDALLDSPVAKLKISGVINFAGQYYDLDVDVSPYVTSSIPLIVGIAAGPVAGAIAWVVNKIATPEIGKAIGFDYHVKGSWDKSKIAKLPVPAETHG